MIVRHAVVAIKRVKKKNVLILSEENMTYSSQDSGSPVFYKFYNPISEWIIII